MPNPVSVSKYVIGIGLLGALGKACFDFKPKTREELFIKLVACFAISTIAFGQGCSEVGAYRRNQFPGQYDNLEMVNKKSNPHRSRQSVKQPGQNNPNLQQGPKAARPAAPPAAFISVDNIF